MNKIVNTALALSVALTATAFGNESQILTKEVHFEKVPHVGGGDSDVFTKGGRETHIELMTANLSPREGGRGLTVEVCYRVKEVKGDKTHLERRETIHIDAPAGYRVISYGSGKVGAAYSANIGGEVHTWFDVSKAVNLQGTLFSSASIRFDGKGRDDEGNAQLRGTLAIPVTLQKE